MQTFVKVTIDDQVVIERVQACPDKITCAQNGNGPGNKEPAFPSYGYTVLSKEGVVVTKPEAVLTITVEIGAPTKDEGGKTIVPQAALLDAVSLVGPGDASPTR